MIDAVKRGRLGVRRMWFDSARAQPDYRSAMQARRDTVGFHSYALAFAMVLTPAILQVSCKGDTTLATLEVEADGVDRIVCFGPNNRSYAFSTRSDTATLTVVTSNPAASAIYQVAVGGAVIEAGLIGDGGGTLAFDVPDGDSELRIRVHAVEGNFDQYTVGIHKLDTTAWSEPQLLASWPDSGNTHVPRVGIDDSGNAVAVWSQFVGTRNVYAARLVAGAWGAPTLLETDDTGSTFRPVIAVAGNGDAVAVWNQDVASGNDNLYANRLISGVWGGAELIATGPAFEPQVALTPTGDGVVVWQQGTGPDRIYASQLTSGVWGTPELLESTIGAWPAGDSPQVTIADNGDAVAVWVELDSPNNDTAYANRLVSGVWAGAEPLELTAGDVSRAHVSVGPSGDGVAVWEQINGIVGKRLVSGSWIWPGGAFFDPTAGTARGPRVVFSDSGDAIVTWAQADSLYSNRLLAATGAWEGPQLVEMETAAPLGGFAIAAAANGDAVAVWNMKECPHRSVYASQLTAGVWGVPELIEFDDTGASYAADVAVDPNGNAVAVWWHLGPANYEIYASQFSVGP